MVNNISLDILNFTKSLLNFPDTAITKVINSPNARGITVVVKNAREVLPYRNCNKPTAGYGLGRTLRFRYLSSFERSYYAAS